MIVCLLFSYFYSQSIREDSMRLLSTKNQKKIPTNNEVQVSGKKNLNHSRFFLFRFAVSSLTEETVQINTR